MKIREFLLRAAVGGGCIGIVVAAFSVHAPRAQAQDAPTTLAQIGMAVAPVPLNLTGKDQQLVGVGSYLVNVIGDCNGCHTGAAPPASPYIPSGNPYFAATNYFLGNALAKKVKTDPSTYLTGGRTFGVAGTPTGPNKYQGPLIVSRNLTPDKNGVPAAGMTFDQFTQVLKNGTDFDHIHPVCTSDQMAQINAGATPPPVCIPTSAGNPVDGQVLQVMPWPKFSNLTDYDIQAIYAYLSAIPCVDNSFSTPPAGAKDQLRNDCGTASSGTVPMARPSR